MRVKARKKKKANLSTFLVIVLVVIGLGVLLYPTFSDLYTRYQISREVGQYNQVLEAEKADYSALWEEAEAYNRSLVGKANHLVPAKDEYELTYELLNLKGGNMLGYIEIPAIDVKLPIYRGTEEKQLQSGTGWWIGSSLPTGGESTHCVIAAHTGLAKAKLFTDLDQMEIGDRFTLTVLDRVMTYEVDQILVTEPDDTEALQIVEGEDYVTLYTCTPYGVNTHRLLVRGTRIETEPEAGTAQEKTSVPSWAILLLCFLLFIGCGLFLWRYGKRRYEKKRYRGRRERSRD